IDHRPAPDRLDNAVEAGTLSQPGTRSPSYGGEQVDETDHLENRYGDAGEEDEQGQRPIVASQELLHTTEDSRRVSPPEHDDSHDRVYVSGNVENHGRDEQGSAPLNRVRPAPVDDRRATRASCGFPR